MAQNQKSYDNEFKAQVVKFAQEIGGHKAANELGIPKGTMYTWIKVFKEGRLSANEAAYGWRRRGTDRHDSGAAAFWTFWLNYSILKLQGNRIRHNPKKSMETNRSCGL